MKYSYETRIEDGYYSIYIFNKDKDSHNEHGILVASGLFEDEANNMEEGICIALYGIEQLIMREEKLEAARVLKDKCWEKYCSEKVTQTYWFGTSDSDLVERALKRYEDAYQKYVDLKAKIEGEDS